MAGFNGIKSVVDAELNGQARSYMWRKTPTQVTTAGIWFDLANTSGNPPAKQWFDAAPLTATAIAQSTDKGLYHGANVSPAQAYLRKAYVYSNSATALPSPMILCDYLLYYPTFDDSEVALQETLGATTLPRYTDGVGVQMIAITTGARTGGQTFTVNYTNSAGVAGRVSQLITQNTSSILGTITNSALTAGLNTAGAFIGLQSGDSGVRSVQSVQMNGVDTGFFTIVLVKPLAEIGLRGTEITPFEKDFLLHSGELTRIYDDAFLGYLTCPNGSVSGLILGGNLRIIWN